MVTMHWTPVTCHFVTYDGNGNVAALVQAQSGTVSANYEYGPFAEPIRITGLAARANPFRLSSKRTDDTTDLVLYEYRAYSPSLGRWPNRDPIEELGHELLKEQSESFSFAGEFGFDAGEGEEREIPESTFMNLYGFIGNNPIYAIDSNGEAAWVVPVVSLGCKVAIKGWKTYRSYKKYLKAMDYTCTGIYAGYKASCAIGCRGTTCEELTASVIALNACVNGRKLYIQQHCDKYINAGRRGKTNKGWEAAEARHKGELENAERALENCIKRKEKACACHNVPEVCPGQ